MKATLTNYRQSPQKTRLVANLIRGKSVHDAMTALSFLPKKSSPAFKKLLDSAVSNARGMGVSAGALFVKTISVDKGLVIRRFKPMARGRAAGIRRTRSIISLELGTIVAKPAKQMKKKEVAVAVSK
ncbi:MAG: large subunit ribosomal protein L22 [Parcubacteria group bacterium Gr01-1014_8]|nr:MAG: large subunit ribosomal protein L22 [Parcubacteria group bacterium Gr01-1014_8]